MQREPRIRLLTRREVLGEMAAVTAVLAPRSSRHLVRLRDSLDDVVVPIMQSEGVPGLSLAIVNDGSIVTRYWGVADVESGLEVSPDSIFEAASLSKPVFARGVMQLVEMGLLDLDRPLVEYGAAPYLEGDPRIDAVTARLVLSHQTGLPNWRRNRELAFISDPGQRFGYSGEGYVYLQRVVEHLTEETLDTFVRRTVLDPLGMTESGYVWREAYDETSTTGHDQQGRPRNKGKPSTGNAAASLHTTASDYALFLAAMLQASVANRQMLTPEVDAGPDLAWGLGWGLEMRPGGQDFWHWGDNGAFKAFATGLPAAGKAVVVFTNSANGLRVCEPIVKEVVGGEHPAFRFGMLDY